MHDMLVRLYAMPDPAPALARVAEQGVSIRRPETRERTLVVDWVRSAFSEGWALECEAAFAMRPVACFVAIHGDALVGFACHDCTRPNFFGPAGVLASARRQGIGAALTLAALAAMRDGGYAYAIIGGVGPAGFYASVTGASPIAGSTPGIYDSSLVTRDARGR